MTELNLFTDGSVAPREKLGVGGYLLVGSLGESLESSMNSIHLQLFRDVTSTDLEIKTLIWALSEIQNRADKPKLTVYTDSQNIVSLLERRSRLEKNKFKNRSGKSLKLAEDYQRFYALLDALKFKVEKVKGHQRKSERSPIEHIFSSIDRATRRELRKQLSS